MSASHTISLVFGDDVAPTVRRRLAYALGVFAAVKGAAVTDEAEVRLCYGAPAERAGDVAVAAHYRPRPPSAPAPAPSTTRVTAPEGGTVRVPVFHSGERGVDWLAELFEWLSAADERAVSERDDVGRVPYAASLHGRLDIDPEVPYAAVAVVELDRLIARTAGGLWTAGCPSPWADTSLGVAATHDIDFLPDHPGAVCSRWARNVAVGALREQSAATTFRAAFSATRPLAGRPWLGDALPRFRAEERERGVDSTWSVVCRSGHRRDPTYRLESHRTRDALQWLASTDAEIAVHGSYTSLVEPGRLLDEYDRLRAFGHDPVGGRQHWLRYAGDDLFRELTRAGAHYDATAGFPAAVGYRNGACFPFPPYDFERERPFPLLEVPLALMDVGLASCELPGGWLERSRGVLRQASRWTWGGVSVLWHDTAVSGALHPESLGRTYFELLDGPGRFAPAKALVDAVRERYAVAGFRIGPGNDEASQ